MYENVSTRFQIKEEIAPNNFESYRGTIRYIGPLENAKSSSSQEQVWVGVEFDDPKRGKHNGIAFGKQYFTTYKNLPSASFFKLEKFRSVVEKPSTFLEALQQRYSHSEEEEKEEIFLSSTTGKKQILIEIVGKQDAIQLYGNAKTLTKISIQEQCLVDHPINQQIISQTCPLVQELDLSNNLITQFQTVVELCQALPHLKSLDLSGNRFSSFDFICSTTFDSISVLALTNTKIQWNSLQSILKLFPNVTELYLSQNDFSTVELVPNKLKLLDLSCNQIDSWNHIATLQQLPLQKLNLKSNLISSIVYNTDSFTQLESLFIGNNAIDNMESMNQLNLFSHLIELRCDNNPCYHSETGRMQVISRIKQLKTLNGSEVTKEERSDCEKYYLKQCALQRWNEKLSLEQILQLHPRYMELVSIWGGDPFESMDASQSIVTKTAKSKLITIVLKRENQAEVKKSIMPTATVQQLKLISQRLFKVKEIVLERVNAPFNDKMNDDTKEVSYYGVENDSVILVLDAMNRSELEIQQRDKHMDLMQRMKKHEEVINKELKVRQQLL